MYDQLLEHIERKRTNRFFSLIALIFIVCSLASCLLGYTIGWNRRNTHPPIFQHSNLINCPPGTIPWLDIPRLDRRPEIVCREVDYYAS